MREQVELLEHESAVVAELAHLILVYIDGIAVLISVSSLLSHVYDLTAVDRLEEGRASQKSRFARTRRADDADDFAAVNVETYILQYFELSEVLFNIIHL